MRVKTLIRIILVFFPLFIVSSLHADTNLLGYTHNPATFIDDAPAAREYVWKAIRVKAAFSGRIDFFRMYVGSIVGNQTNAEVGWGLYEDNNGEVGALKISGYTHNHNWSNGTPGNHDFPVTTVHTDANIVAGRWYWITTQTSSQDNILISRGRISGCTDRPALRKFINANQYLAFTTPPSPDLYINNLAEGCYGWSVWQNDGSPVDTISPSPPTNLRVE